MNFDIRTEDFPAKTPWTVASQAPLSIEQVSILCSRGSSRSSDLTQVSHITGRFFAIWAHQGNPKICHINGLEVWLVHPSLSQKERPQLPARLWEEGWRSDNLLIIPKCSDTAEDWTHLLASQAQFSWAVSWQATSHLRTYCPGTCPPHSLQFGGFPPCSSTCWHHTICLLFISRLEWKLLENRVFIPEPKTEPPWTKVALRGKPLNESVKQPSSWTSWEGLWRLPSPFLKFFTKGNWEQSRDSKWLLRFDTGTGLCVFKVLSRYTIPIWLPTHSLKIVLVVTMESSLERLSCSGSHKQNLNSSVSHPRTLLYTSRLGMTNVFDFKRQVWLRGMLPRATILRSQATSSFCRKVCDWLAIVPLMQEGE